MTLSEFMAWLEGFSEALPAGAGLTADQFAKMRAKLASVHGDVFPIPAPTPMPWPGVGDFPHLPNTGDYVPRFGEVLCDVDWSADHLEAIRAIGRNEFISCN